MPYTVSCTPAPLTFTIRPSFGWQFLSSIAWVCFIGYQLIFVGLRNTLRSAGVFGFVIFGCISGAILLSLIRRERIEIYPSHMIWSKTYFGFTRSPLLRSPRYLGPSGAKANSREKKAKDQITLSFIYRPGP